MTAPPVLYLFCGLPGAGKSTLAARLAEDRGAVYLRIDAINQGLRHSALKLENAMDGGYAVARALAAENLAIGQSVVADAVHWRQEERQVWDEIGADSLARRFWIEVACSDEAMRQDRIERRSAKEGRLGWDAIGPLTMDPVHDADLCIDTAVEDLNGSLARLFRALP